MSGTEEPGVVSALLWEVQPLRLHFGQSQAPWFQSWVQALEVEAARLLPHHRDPSKP